MTERVPWSSLAILTLAGLALVGIGAGLTLLYCEYRRVSEVQQLTRLVVIDSMCVASLTDVTRAAVVFARTQPRPIMLATPARDSLRERRWSTP